MYKFAKKTVSVVLVLAVIAVAACSALLAAEDKKYSIEVMTHALAMENADIMELFPKEEGGNREWSTDDEGVDGDEAVSQDNENDPVENEYDNLYENIWNGTDEEDDLWNSQDNVGSDSESIDAGQLEDLERSAGMEDTSETDSGEEASTSEGMDDPYRTEGSVYDGEAGADAEEIRDNELENVPEDLNALSSGSEPDEIASVDDREAILISDPENDSLSPGMTDGEADPETGDGNAISGQGSMPNHIVADENIDLSNAAADSAEDANQAANDREARTNEAESEEKPEAKDARTSEKEDTDPTEGEASEESNAMLQDEMQTCVTVCLVNGSGVATILLEDQEYHIRLIGEASDDMDSETDDSVVSSRKGELKLAFTPGSIATIRLEPEEGYVTGDIFLAAGEESRFLEDCQNREFFETTLNLTEGLERIEISFLEKDPYFIREDFDYSMYSALNFSSQRLLVGTYEESILVDDGSVLSGYDGIYLLQFADEATTLRAYAYYMMHAEFVEADTGIMIAGDLDDAPVWAFRRPGDAREETQIEAGETEGHAAEQVDTETFMTIEENPLAMLEEAVSEPEPIIYDIAIIDTGANGADGQVSMLGEDPWDYNGHGTAVLEYIREYAPDAKVLSIKALDADGKGDISAVYAAMQYAIEQGVRIINMSISALASQDSSVIEMAADEAAQRGILVVGAAGNNAKGAGWYIPGKIDSAYIIGACGTNGTRAETSNYGPTVDYAVVAGSTSEAAARFSGWIFANGIENIKQGFLDGFLFAADGTPDEDIPTLSDVDFNIANFDASPYQDMTGKVYSYGDANHPTPDTSIYSTGRKYTDIATVTINNPLFYTFVNDQGIRVIGINQNDIEESRWAYTDSFGRDYYAERFSVFDHPFSIKLSGAAVDAKGKELDLTVSFDKVVVTRMNMNVTITYLTGIEYLWGEYTTPYAYQGTDWVAAILDDQMWSNAAGGYSKDWPPYPQGPFSSLEEQDEAIREWENSRVTPYAYWFGGMNTITLSWAYSDGTPFSGNVDYAFIDIDSGQEKFLGRQEHKPDYLDYQESITLNSGWTGVYKQVPDSQWYLTTTNNDATYLCGEGDTDTFRSGFVASANKDATVTWTGNYCGTIFYYIWHNNKGALRVEKTSSDTSYKKSLAGAVFGIYSDSACTKLVQEVTTDASGVAATEGYSLEAGKYYVKETKAPEGYDLNTKTFTATVSVGETAVVSVEDNPESKGSLQIQKVVDTAGLSDDAAALVKASSSYSVAGAQYTVYTDSACTKKYGSQVLTIVADDATGMSGTSNIITEVPNGTYYMKETKAGTGLSLDTKVYSVTITSANAKTTQKPSSKSKDAPVLGTLSFTKASGIPAITDGNNSYALSGAKYGIYTDNACTKLFAEGVTDAQGKFSVSNLPFGTYYIKELTPSKGYGLAQCASGKESDLHVVTISASNLSAAVTCTEPVKADPLSLLLVKQDQGTGKETPQGSAVFAGAQYTVKYYDNENWNGSPKRTWIFAADDAGRIEFTASFLQSGSDALYFDHAKKAVIPAGSFTIQETKAPAGYRLDEAVYQYKVNGTAVSYTAQNAGITAIGTTPAHASGQDLAVTSPETVIRGGVRFQKIDAQTLQPSAQGAGSLQGAAIAIYNISKNAIYTQGKWYEPAAYQSPDDLRQNGTPVITLLTNESGQAQTTANLLPYGEYIAIETKAPKGYECNTDWSVTFQIREDGKVADTYTQENVHSSYGSDAKSGWISRTTGLGLEKQMETAALADMVIRRDFEFLKVDIDGTPMANTPFLMTLYGEAGNALESHVFVTDENGWYKSAQKSGTNRNALDSLMKDGWYTKDGQPADPSVQDKDVLICFGDTGNSAETDGKKHIGALVYGTYRIEELRTLANAGRHETLQYSHDSFAVKEAGTDPLFLGAMVNVEVTLETHAEDSLLGLSMTRIGSEIEVCDTVTYDHLDTRNTYILRTSYQDIFTGEEVGTGELRFRPEPTSEHTYTTGLGHVTVDGVLDTTSYEGKGGRISVCTRLYQEVEIGGKMYEMLVATHNEDLSDEAETLFIPSVMTQAIDTATQDHVGAYTEVASIQDMVKVDGLAQKSNYKLTAQAVNNKDESIIGESELRFSTGNGVNSASRTMPEITFDSRELASGSVTIYEKLYYLDEAADGTVVELLVGSHATALDPDQTVWYAGMDTVLLSENGTHGWEATGQELFTDRIYLDSLVPGEGYTLKGVLMDAKTGESLLDDQGNEVRAEAAFTAEDAAKEAVLTYSFSILETLKEKDESLKTVSFVTLWHADALVASREQLDDAQETVTIVPPRYKRYADPDMSQESVVVEQDIISYKIAWSQAQYDHADVWVRDILSSGLEYVAGSAVDQNGESLEPQVNGRELLWELPDCEAGAYGTITYDVVVTSEIRTTPVVRNQYETSIRVGEDTEQIWTTIGSLENPGSPDKQYANDILGQEIPVLSEAAIVYEGKQIEYVLTWVNPYMDQAVVELRDTLSPGLSLNKETCSAEPASITANEDGSTTLYWKLDATAHAWGNIRYTVTASTQILSKETRYRVSNDYDIRVTRKNAEAPGDEVPSHPQSPEDPQDIEEPESPDDPGNPESPENQGDSGDPSENPKDGNDPENGAGNGGWQDVRELSNPVPHFRILKTRVENASSKNMANNAQKGIVEVPRVLYGFRRGDVITYMVEIINDGETDIALDLSDAFDDPDVFENLQLEAITGEGVSILSQEETNARLLIAASSTAIVTYKTRVAETAGEYLATTEADNKDDTDDGYANTALAQKAVTTYIDHNGNRVTLTDGTITISPEAGTESEDALSGSTEPKTGDQQREEGTPSETGEPGNGELPGEEGSNSIDQPTVQDTVSYAVSIPDLEDRQDSANTPVQVPVPGFTIQKERPALAPGKDGIGGYYGFERGETVMYHVTVENTGGLDLELTVSDEYAQDAKTYFKDLRIANIKGEALERIDDTQVRLRIPVGTQAVVTYQAAIGDNAPELLSDLPYDHGEGYLNIARAQDIQAVWTSNDGTPKHIDPDSSNGEFAKELTGRESHASTPVQVPTPQDPTTQPEQPTPPETKPQEPATPQPPEPTTKAPEPATSVPTPEPPTTQTPIPEPQESQPPASESPKPVTTAPAQPAQVPAPQSPEAPKTGDDSNLLLWFGIGGGSLFMLLLLSGIILLRRRR